MDHTDIDIIDAGVSPTDLVLERRASKAVLVRGEELLMLRSRFGDYKFPGGGHEPGESHAEALARELREECGVVGVGVGELLVRVREQRPAREPQTTFSMVSDYFHTVLEPGAGATDAATALDTYELELELTPQWVTPREAHDANAQLAQQLDPTVIDREIPWVARETRVLEAIVEIWPSLTLPPGSSR